MPDGASLSHTHMVAASTIYGCSLHHIWLQAVLDLIKTQERLARSGNYLEAQKIERKVHENLRKDASSMQATPRRRTRARTRARTRTRARHAHVHVHATHTHTHTHTHTQCTRRHTQRTRNAHATHTQRTRNAHATHTHMPSVQATADADAAKKVDVFRRQQRLEIEGLVARIERGRAEHKGHWAQGAARLMQSHKNMVTDLNLRQNLEANKVSPSVSSSKQVRSKCEW